MLEYYVAVVDTLILIAVALEAFVTWRLLQYKNRESIKRSVRTLIKSVLKHK